MSHNGLMGNCIDRTARILWKYRYVCTHLLIYPFTILLMLPASTLACPLCKESLFDPAQLQQKLSLAKGYALSITLLLVVPLVLVAGIATLIVRAHRRKQHV